MYCQRVPGLPAVIHAPAGSRALKQPRLDAAEAGSYNEPVADSTATLPGQVIVSGKRRIEMERRVCVVTPGRIEVRPSRASLIVPVAGLALGFLCFAAVIALVGTLPFPLLVLLLLLAVVILPISGMGFVYSALGAHVVMEKRKQSIVWQQGFLGMGVGTRELVPFWKIQRLEVTETVPQDQRGLPQDLAQYEVTLLKTSGRRLKVGAVTVPRSLAGDGLARARAVAEAVGAMADKPIELPRAVGARRRHTRRRHSPPKAR